MKKKIPITAISLLLLFCFAGCSLKGTIIPDHDPAKPTDGHTESIAATNAFSTDPSVPETETQPSTVLPTQAETIPQQTVTQPEPRDEDFVKVASYIPGIVIDLCYATEDNFTNQRIYDFTDAWLRYGTVKKLMLVQEELKQHGYGLKLWDGFRPPAAQFRLWEICPDPTYVSNPNNGFSSHSRGNTVDITLVQADGTELVMPTAFDDFSKLADRDYSDCSKEAAENAILLEQLMIKYGFKPYSGEWWHFSDNQSYPVEQAFEPLMPAEYYADCNEYISLRTTPDITAEVITQIPAGARIAVVANSGDFALVEYQDLLGYVLRSYIKPLN